MRNRIHLFVIAILVFAGSVHSQSNTTISPGKDSLGVAPVKIAYEFAQTDLVPEGIAYDAVAKNLYVSSTYRRKIIRISQEGSVSDFTSEKQDGLLGVLGMRVDPKRRILWAISTAVGKYMPIRDAGPEEYGTGVYKYDLKTNTLLKRYLVAPTAGQALFNDIVIDKSGKPYFTATQGGKIFTISEASDSLEVFYELPPGYMPNGIDITADNKNLFVALYGEPNDVIARIEIKTRRFHILEIPEEWKAGADGLYVYKKDLIAVLPGQSSKVVRFRLDTGQNRVIHREVLVNDSPLLSRPTTGVIVNDLFYYVATSNLPGFRKLFEEGKGNVNPDDLPPLRIGVVSLK